MGFSQGNSSSPGSGSSVSLAFGSPVAAGDTLICAIRAGASSITGISIGDSVNGAGSWSAVSQEESVGGDTLIVGYFTNSAAGTPTVSASWSGAGSIRIIILDYSGVVVSSVDRIATLQGGPTSNHRSADTAITQTNEILIGITETNLGSSLISGFTDSNPPFGWTNRYSVDVGKLVADDNFVLGVATYNENWGVVGGAQDDFSSCIISLKTTASQPLNLVGPTFLYPFV